MASGKQASDCGVSLRDEESVCCATRKTHCGERWLLLECAEGLAETSCCFRAAPAAKDPGRSDWKRGKGRHCLLLTVSK